MSELPLFSLDWLADTFDIGTPVTASIAGRGQSNPLGVLHVETTCGDYGVKRYAQTPRRQGLEIEFLAASSGVPMAWPIKTCAGDFLGVCSHDGMPAWVHVYSWVEGIPCEWHTVDANLATHMGSLLAAIHALSVPAEALLEERWTPLGANGWQTLAQHADAAGIHWAPLLRERIHDLCAWEDLIVAHAISGEPLVPSQRDLHPPNVIMRPNGSCVLLDWDAAGPIIAREDVAMFALVWGTREDGTIVADAVRGFVRGYRASGGCYQSRGYVDLLGRERNRLAWIEHNVRRYIEEVARPDPWLPVALLEGVHTPDLAKLEQLADLLDIDM